MAIPVNRRERPADACSQDRLPTSNQLQHHEPSEFPPTSRDRLCRVRLTRRALQSLDKQSRKRVVPKHAAPAEAHPTSIARFSRHGGPDLCDLRGYTYRTIAMATLPSLSKSTNEQKKQSITSEPSTSKAKRSSAYDTNFEEQLFKHCIYLPHHGWIDIRPDSSPADLGKTRELLRVRRASLSPSTTPVTVFEQFQWKNMSPSGATIMRTIIPTLAGNDTHILNEGELTFSNLDSLTGDATAKPTPDFFDGAMRGTVKMQVQTDLYKTVVPTRLMRVPVACNFFLEAKAPRGGVDVTERQACQDGAYGAQAMHSLQNYGRQEPIYDGNAYTYSSTYQAGAGVLSLYAHHIAAPETIGDAPRYHMTILGQYQVTGSLEGFIEGATAFRNARDLARQHRDTFIEAANARARSQGPNAAGHAQTSATEIKQEVSSSPGGLERFAPKR